MPHTRVPRRRPNFQSPPTKAQLASDATYQPVLTRINAYRQKHHLPIIHSPRDPAAQVQRLKQQQQQLVQQEGSV